ncbi:hypothetical protein EMIT0196MI5_210090 [Pseudomonas sp. IT-196MI5]
MSFTVANRSERCGSWHSVGWQAAFAGKPAPTVDQRMSVHAGRSEADRWAMPPDEYRSEGTPSLSEGPYIRA